MLPPILLINFPHCQADYAIGELQLIFHPVSPHWQRPLWSWKFLVYVCQFNIVPQGSSQCDLTILMYVLRQAKRTNRKYFGDIIPLDQLHSPANLVPQFGKSADKCLSSTNSCAMFKEFWLNRYWDKEIFYALYNDSK